MIFFSLILLLIILLVILIIYLRLHKIVFLSNHSTYNLIKNDEDKYFANFTECDKKARNINNINDYINRIQTDNFDVKYKMKLYICVIKANIFFRRNFKYNKYNLTNDMIDIPFIFALTKNNTYENGLPHTRNNNVIFLSREILNKSYDDLTSIIIHEKIHCDQKINKSKYDDLYNKLGLIKIDNNKTNKRANPDGTNDVYYNKKDKFVYEATYINCNNINNVNIHNDNVKYEHPNEEIAYNIQELYLSNCDIKSIILY